MDKGTWIYALDCPVTYRVRYVGKSKKPQTRFQTHLHDATNEDMYNWMAELTERELKPGICYLERVPDEESSEAESRWINLLIRYGHVLLNKTYRGAKRGRVGAAAFTPHKPGFETIAEAAKRIGIGAQQARIYCIEKRWPGAFQESRRWLVPIESVPHKLKKRTKEGPKKKESGENGRVQRNNQRSGAETRSESFADSPTLFSW